MIIWSGLGWLVILIVIAFMAIANTATDAYFPGQDYFKNNQWPRAVA
ncbi:MAG: hypothetical protein R3E96_14845 [Planctomycetota bacterium]